MNRRYRLTSPQDFERVRRAGKSYAHPLLVVIACQNDLPNPRFGFGAARALGGAVERNRARRRLRAAARLLQPRVSAGWDIILIARPGIAQADFHSLSGALADKLTEAGLITAEATL
jgi:ribonuclease P protein component